MEIFDWLLRIERLGYLSLANFNKHNISFAESMNVKLQKKTTVEHCGCTTSPHVISPDATSHVADVLPSNTDHIAINPL